MSKYCACEDSSLQIEEMNPTFLFTWIENMKGVLKASIKRETKDKKEDWLDKLHSIKDAIDPSLIDMNDERTRYIMGK